MNHKPKSDATVFQCIKLSSSSMLRLIATNALMHGREKQTHSNFGFTYKEPGNLYTFVDVDVYNHVYICIHSFYCCNYKRKLIYS